jgi:hypothetical protein
MPNFAIGSAGMHSMPYVHHLHHSLPARSLIGGAGMHSMPYFWP